MSNQLPIVIGSHAAESGKKRVAAYCRVHRVIGLLAFLLGVCVTVLCFRLRQMHRENTRDTESEGRHGAD